MSWSEYLFSDILLDVIRYIESVFLSISFGRPLWFVYYLLMDVSKIYYDVNTIDDI